MVLVEIARIDPDLFHDGRHGDGRFRGEVDVGDQRDITARRAYPVLDLPDVRDVLQARNGDPDKLRPGRGETERLRHRRIDIIRMGIAHRLDDDRVIPADQDITYFDYACFHYCSISGFRSSVTYWRAIRRRLERVCPRRLVSW